MLELIQVADALLRLGTDRLDRFGDHVRRIPAERNPPQQRIAHVDFRALQTVEERIGTIRQKSAKIDRKSTRLNFSHTVISYAVFCLKKKKKKKKKGKNNN